MTRQAPASGPIDERSLRLERVVVSTDNIAPSDRFEWWRSEFSPLHKVEVAPECRRSFRAHGEHWQLGSILIGRYRTPVRRVVRTPADIRRNEIDHWVLRVARTGVVESRSSSGSFRAFPGQVTIGSFADSYTDDYSAGEWIAAMIPRQAFPSLAVQAPSVLSGVKAGLLTDFLTSLDRRLPEALPTELPALAEMTRAMMVACLVGDRASTLMTPAERLVVLRERVDQLIREHIASARLDTERICALAGISRSTLYRLFENRGGVAAHVQALRLKCIHADLGDPRLADQTIARLAAGRGLHNAAAFNRAFRRRFGCTPGEIRAAALSADTEPPKGAFPFPGRRFADLL